MVHQALLVFCISFSGIWILSSAATGTVKLGDPCSVAGNCSVAGALCINKTVCTCPTTKFQFNKTTCTLLITLGQSCTADKQCAAKNAECKKKTCTCKATHYTNSNACTPRIVPGGTQCKGNSSCVPNAYCHKTNHTCLCQTGYTATKTACSSGMVFITAEIAVLLVCMLLSNFST